MQILDKKTTTKSDDMLTQEESLKKKQEYLQRELESVQRMIENLGKAKEGEPKKPEEEDTKPIPQMILKTEEYSHKKRRYENIVEFAEQREKYLKNGFGGYAMASELGKGVYQTDNKRDQRNNFPKDSTFSQEDVGQINGYIAKKIK